jgi:hypothetical protein
MARIARARTQARFPNYLCCTTNPSKPPRHTLLQVSHFRYAHTDSLILVGDILASFWELVLIVSCGIVVDLPSTPAFERVPTLLGSRTLDVPYAGHGCMRSMSWTAHEPQTVHFDARLGGRGKEIYRGIPVRSTPSVVDNDELRAAGQKLCQFG